MNEYKKISTNDGNTEFDKKYTYWANNHNGWRKAKKMWRRKAKTIIKRGIKKEINEALNEVERY